MALKTAGRHLLEADDEDTIGTAMADELSRHMQTSGAGRAIVIDIVDGDLGHAELIEHTLATGGIAVAIARDALVYIVVVDLRIQHSLDAGLQTLLR